jgi:hypothetical protein
LNIGKEYKQQGIDKNTQDFAVTDWRVDVVVEGTLHLAGPDGFELNKRGGTRRRV